MRLGIFTTSFRPYQWYSGISNAAYLLEKGLNEKHGVETTVYAPLYKGMRRKEVHKNFSIERFKTISINAWLGYYISFDAFRKISNNNPDVIHSFHYGYFPATAGFSEAKKRHIPHLFTTAYHMPSSRINRQLLKVYDITQGSRIIRGSDFVLPFNKNEESQLRSISNGRFNIIPCPINQNVFRAKNINSSKLTVAFVGALEAWKGPQVAFDIFNQIAKERNDVEFIFVGNGTLKHQIDLYNKLMSAGKKSIGRRIHFTRELTVQQLADVYNKSDVLIAPTLYESFGCILAESMMCGTPVVSTRVGAVPETVGNGGILVNYGDWDGMKKSVSSMLDDSKLRKK